MFKFPLENSGKTIKNIYMVAYCFSTYKSYLKINKDNSFFSSYILALTPVVFEYLHIISFVCLFFGDVPIKPSLPVLSLYLIFYWDKTFSINALKISQSLLTLMRFFCTAYEKATKEQRMRTEISQAKREANFYIQNVEKGKAIEAMETRKRKRADQVGHVIFTLHLYSFDFVMAKGFKTRCETRPSGTGQNPQGSICLEGISYLSGDDKPELFFFL